uniref:Uncharacterized protein n=1 Tax=Oryza meridionalis TaxID=40149 RepID=A0A0E0DXB3_9ORYZ
MEQFHDGHRVWLRSRVHGTYLHADDDGRGVSLRPHGASLNAAWMVHLDDRNPVQRLLLLHSAAYGRYLAGTTTPAPSGLLGYRVAQRDFDLVDDDSVLWQALCLDSGDDVLLRHATGRYLHDNDGTSITIHDHEDHDSSSSSRRTHWVVETIGPKDSIPSLSGPRPSQIQDEPVIRNIRFIRAIPQGLLSDNWTAFQFSGRSVDGLKQELARRAAVDLVIQYSLCIRAGCHGRLTPLLLHLLPHNNETLDVVLMMTGPTNSGSGEKKAGKKVATSDSLSEHPVIGLEEARSKYLRLQNEVICEERKRRIKREQFEQMKRNIRWDDLTLEEKKITRK